MRSVWDAVSSSLVSAVGLVVAGLLLAVRFGDGYAYECGGFISLTTSSTGSIESPGYPGNHSKYTRCIWILEAPDQYVPLLNITFEGKMVDSVCTDYVEFKDGGEDGRVIEKNCSTMTSEALNSTGRWMYVLFSSGGLSQKAGLSATYSAKQADSDTSVSSAVRKCRSFEFECRNRICLSMSYRCDGYNDCGCGEDCDEDGCGGLSIDKPTRMGIGFAVGISVFVLAAALGLLLEKRHNWEKDKGQSSSSDAQKRAGWGSVRDNKIGTGDWKDPSASKAPPPFAIHVTEAV